MHSPDFEISQWLLSEKSGLLRRAKVIKIAGVIEDLIYLFQVDWGKGRALSHMLKALSLDECDDVIPIYLGDDRTDEDAFKVLRERGAGFGILISNKVSPVAASTHPFNHASSHCLLQSSRHHSCQS